MSAQDYARKVASDVELEVKFQGGDLAAGTLLETRRLRRLSQPLNRRYQRQWTNNSAIPGATGKDLTLKQAFEVSIPRERPRGPGWPFSWYLRNTGSQDTMSLWRSETLGRKDDQQRPTGKYSSVVPGGTVSERSDPARLFIQFDTNAGGDIGIEYVAEWYEGE